jgi:hypothetical protein
MKKGQELADAAVLFDDAVLTVQVKDQCGRHDPVSWATEKLLEAFPFYVPTGMGSFRGNSIPRLLHGRDLLPVFESELELDKRLLT